MMKDYYRYWGKARKREDGTGYDFHLLAYHCMDVAAVGRVWLEEDGALNAGIAHAIGLLNDKERLNKIISLFFTLHDFGKFDIRFQSKVPEIRDELWDGLNPNDLLLSNDDISKFDHGKNGYGAFIRYYKQLFMLEDENDDLLDVWKPWMAGVTGHHGIIPKSATWVNPPAEPNIIEHDRNARKEWFQTLIKLFDGDNGDIPFLSEEVQPFIAGLCSVCDWVASNELFVRWIKDDMNPEQYYYNAIEHCRQTDILKRFGLIGRRISKYQNIAVLLPDKKYPQQIQTLIDTLPIETGLTIIEGTTGSGKTEAAFALAWKLIAGGKAGSIIFALPTQATANAMLERLYKLAPILFEDGDANLVLAHGKAKYNELFEILKETGKRYRNNFDQGMIQCTEWISSSRKLVFLGQIGVCTIDQVLLGVVPVRHNFIRSFGVAKSVLIVDEVHAYDRYMYGLLEEVLKRQKSLGGSTILLSATLPAIQKKELFESWLKDSSKEIIANSPYPLISLLPNSGRGLFKSVDKNNAPPARDVHIEIVVTQDMEPDDAIVDRLFSAAQNGATVGVVCNLVQSAQKTARLLQGICQLPVDIFHSRYRFIDRQKKETVVKRFYGKESPRTEGRILVATQVIEQSLDLDFDWLLSQLCPVDLLFQRMGRLHRHERKRPAGYEKPMCTILSIAKNDFGAHEMIYGDTRILWRTREKLVNCNQIIQFPGAYRDWIEEVYGREEWLGQDEPISVIGKSCAYREMQKQAWYDAQLLTAGDINHFDDTDQNATSLTRGKEMGLNIVPLIADEKEKTLLDGECKNDVNEFEWGELLNMNAIPTPARWKVWLPRFEDGYIFLPMTKVGCVWEWKNGNKTLTYTTDYGLERLEE